MQVEGRAWSRRRTVWPEFGGRKGRRGARRSLGGGRPFEVRTAPKPHLSIPISSLDLLHSAPSVLQPRRCRKTADQTMPELGGAALRRPSPTPPWPAQGRRRLGHVTATPTQAFRGLGSHRSAPPQTAAAELRHRGGGRPPPDMDPTGCHLAPCHWGQSPTLDFVQRWTWHPTLDIVQRCWPMPARHVASCPPGPTGPILSPHLILSSLALRGLILAVRSKTLADLDRPFICLLFYSCFPT